MEVIPGLSREIREQIVPTSEAFNPLLRPHAAKILATPSKTFKYGATDRHQLDICFPSHTASGSAPVLFFEYGGGYMQGDKVLQPPNELVYRNVGAFYALHGLVTVIANYRLYPDVKYPDPAIDIKDALAWVVAHVDEVNADVPVKADVSQVFLMGHSAGASTIATMLLEPGLIPTPLRARIAGAILQAGAYHWRTAQGLLPPPVILEYYGSEEEQRKREPLGLLENATPEILTNLPPLLLTIGEFDAPAAVICHKDFLDALNERLPSPVPTILMAGHNHISVQHALMTGQGEQYALDIIAWIASKTR